MAAASSGKPIRSTKNATRSSAPSARLTWSGKAAGAIASPPRRSNAPTPPPSAIAPICPHDDGAPSAMTAAATASVARARHAEHRLRHDRDRRHLEAVQPAGAGGIAEGADAVAEGHHGDGRRQREADPGCERSGIPAPQKADGEPHLARRRSGQELAERDQIGVALVVEPAAAVDELFAKIAEMRHRPAEGGQPEPQERGEDFTPAPARTRVSGSGFLARRHRQVIAGRTAARYR